MNNHAQIQTTPEQDDAFECPAYFEPAVLLIAMLAALHFMGQMQMRDEAAKTADIKQEYMSKCHWYQPRMITEFDCVVINERLAVIK